MPRDLTYISLDGLKIFASVVNLGSITRAAETLKMDRRTITIRIEQIERQLGYDLFIKTKDSEKRSRILTTKGSSLLKTINNILGNLSYALDGLDGQATLVEELIYQIHTLHEHIWAAQDKLIEQVTGRDSATGLLVGVLLGVGNIPKIVIMHEIPPK